MRIFDFEKVLRLEHPLARVFEFFSDAFNLEKITPPWLQFHVLTAPPIQMHEGTQIDYRLRIHGIPVRWTSQITAWEPPYRFVDEQLRGPYRLWHHEHTFKADGESTIMADRVQYAVWGGAVVQRLLVKRDVDKIFAYRSEQIPDLLRTWMAKK